MLGKLSGGRPALAGLFLCFGFSFSSAVLADVCPGWDVNGQCSAMTADVACHQQFLPTYDCISGDCGAGGLGASALCKDRTGTSTGSIGGCNLQCEKICTSGQREMLHGSGDTVTTSMCFGGCSYSPVLDGDGFTVYYNAASGIQSFSATFESSGQKCNADTPGSGSDPNNCATDSHGNQICKSATGSGGTVNGQPFQPSGTNCGYVNQVYRCYSPSSGGCAQLTGGAVFCSGNPLPSSAPPTPDNGTPGQPQPPDIRAGSAGQPASSSTYGYWSSSTTASSSQTPNGNGTDSGGTQGGRCGGPGQPPCSTCGGDGQPACKPCGKPGDDCWVHVDESEVPSTMAPFADPDVSEARDLVKDAADAHPFGGFGAPSTAMLGGQGSCDQITVDIPQTSYSKASSVVFPSADACSSFATLRDAFGAFCGIVFVLWAAGSTLREV